MQADQSGTVDEKAVDALLGYFQELHIVMLVEILEKKLGLETKVCDVPTKGTDIVIKIRAPLKTLDFIAEKNHETLKLN